MSTQTGFDRFTESTETAEAADIWGFDEYGPTADRPIPEAERMTLHKSGGELVDEREIPDSGLSLSDITDWPYINDERSNPNELDGFQEIMSDINPTHEADEQTDENPAELAADLGEYWNPAGTPLHTPESTEDLDDFDNETDARYYEIVFGNSQNPMARAVANVTESIREGQDIALETVGNEHIDAPIIDSETIHTKISRIHSIRPIEEKTSEDEKSENRTPDAGDDSETVAADGGTVETDIPVADPANPPEDETVLLITGITRLMHSPQTVEGTTSSTGKTISVEIQNGNTFRLDASEIFAGNSEFRDAKYFEIYTPARLRKNQRANHAPGPQAGANEVSDVDDLPDPTHWPANDEPADAPDVCPDCGAEGVPWADKKRPVCEACGEMLPEEGDETGDETEDTPDTVDKWDLSRLDRGDLLILDGYRGEFVVTRVNTFATNQTVRSVDVAKREGGEWRAYELKKLDSMKGHRLQVERENETNPFVNVDDPDHARDFEVIGNDPDRVRRYIRDSRRD